jgi:hypothetical protein
MDNENDKSGLVKKVLEGSLNFVNEQKKKKESSGSFGFTLKIDYHSEDTSLNIECYEKVDLKKGKFKEAKIGVFKLYQGKIVNLLESNIYNSFQKSILSYIDEKLNQYF